MRFIEQLKNKVISNSIRDFDYIFSAIFCARGNYGHFQMTQIINEFMMIIANNVWIRVSVVIILIACAAKSVYWVGYEFGGFLNYISN